MFFIKETILPEYWDLKDHFPWQNNKAIVKFLRLRIKLMGICFLNIETNPLNGNYVLSTRQRDNAFLVYEFFFLDKMTRPWPCFLDIEWEREIMLFIGKPTGRSRMISNRARPCFMYMETVFSQDILDDGDYFSWTRQIIQVSLTWMYVSLTRRSLLPLCVKQFLWRLKQKINRPVLPLWRCGVKSLSKKTVSLIKWPRSCF